MVATVFNLLSLADIKDVNLRSSEEAIEAVL